MGELNDEKKYKSYLQTISLISFLTAIIESVLFLFHWYSGIKGHIFCAIISIAVLVIFCFLGSQIANGTEIFDPIDKFFRNCNKGRAVTVLFFSHLVCVSLFIIQDGGAQTSCISNILLLDASFGYFFAAKKIVKCMVNILCVSSYLLCFLVYFDNDKQAFVTNFTFEIIPYIFPYLLTILFVLGVNTIINYQITNGGKKSEEAKDQDKSPC